MKTFEVDVYVHISGIIEAESDSEGDILDGLFPDGWEGEVDSVTTDPNHYPKGYILCIDEDEDDE